MDRNSPNKIIVHHSADVSSTPQFDRINADHKARFAFISGLGFYVGYHYLVEASGEVKQARKETEEGAHTIGQNLSSVGICLAGNFNETLPNELQKQSLCRLIEEISARWLIRDTNIFPHRTFSNTSCFGSLLPESWARDVYRQYKKKGIIQKLSQLLEKLAKLYEKLISNRPE